MTKEISNSNLFAISFILSLAYLLGFEPFGFQIVGLLSISGLLFAALNTDEKKASLIFFLFGLFVYSIGLYWLYISIHIISFIYIIKNIIDVTKKHIKLPTNHYE